MMGAPCTTPLLSATLLVVLVVLMAEASAHEEGKQLQEQSYNPFVSRSRRAECSGMVADECPSNRYCNICKGKCKKYPKLGKKCGTRCRTDTCRGNLVCVDKRCVEPEPNSCGTAFSHNGNCVGSCPYGMAADDTGKCVPYKWCTGKSLQVPLAEISAVVIDDTLVFFGDGDLWTNNKKWTLGWDFKAQNWVPLGSLDERLYFGDHTAVEMYKGKMYAFAGLCCQRFCSGCKAEQKVQIYDYANNKWTLGQKIPWKLDGGASSAIIDGKIYLCGGLYMAPNGWEDAINDCGIYDPETDSWDTGMANIPKAVHHTASGTDGKKFYVFGGREGSNGLSDGQDDVQVYDPQTEKWESSEFTNIKPMPQGRTGIGKAAFLGGEFYVSGGEAFQGTPNVTPLGTFDRVDIYNPVTNSWRSGPPMPHGLHGHFPIVYEGKMIMAGGGEFIDRGSSSIFQMYIPSSESCDQFN